MSWLATSFGFKGDTKERKHIHLLNNLYHMKKTKRVFKDKFHSEWYIDRPKTIDEFLDGSLNCTISEDFLSRCTTHLGKVIVNEETGIVYDYERCLIFDNEKLYKKDRGGIMMDCLKASLERLKAKENKCRGFILQKIENVTKSLEERSEFGQREVKKLIFDPPD